MEKNILMSDQSGAELDDAAYDDLNLPFCTFTSYFISWIYARRRTEKYANMLESLEIHELLVNSNESEIIEGSTDSDFSRVIFLIDTRSKIIQFGFICKEYGSRQLTYIAFLESFKSGRGYLEPIIRSYAEYVSIISDGEWTLHIWADPPSKEVPTFFFRNKPQTVLDGMAAGKLKEKYAKYLTESGFSGNNYAWTVTCPPLPPFGIKSEDETTAKHEALVNAINVAVDNFNKTCFKDTHCAKLKRPREIPIQDTQGGKIAKIESTLWTSEHLRNDPELDFSTDAKALASSNLIVKRMKESYKRDSNSRNYYMNKFSKVKKTKSHETYEIIARSFFSSDEKGTYLE